MQNTSRILIGVLLLVTFLVAAGWIYQRYLAPEPQQPRPTATAIIGSDDLDQISAEAQVVPARRLTLGFIQGGRVAEVLIRVGDAVKAGDVLVRLEDQTLQASLAQAEAALALAQANLQAANTKAEQIQMAVQMEDAPARTADWQARQPAEIGQPAWYFDQAQQIASAQAAVESAHANLQKEQQRLDTLLAALGGSNFLQTEAALANAQAEFLIASDLLTKARLTSDRNLQDQAQAAYDIAKSRLEAAQADYDEALKEDDALDILEARARLSVARERYQLALDRLYRLQTGDYSLELQTARDTVAQAEAAVTQAEAALQAAQAALEETVLRAPIDGVVVSTNVESGELVTPGLPVIRLADLSAWRVETTDLVENDVIYLSPGMSATITLDAFPNQTFLGTVREISLVGENSRGLVVYTVSIAFDPGKAAVRWGMTAFVDIKFP